MFRFTIRDVLWLMVVVGLALGWRLDRKHLQPLASEAKGWKFRAESLAEHLRNDGWTVEYGDWNAHNQSGKPHGEPWRQVFAVDKNGNPWPSRSAELKP